MDYNESEDRIALAQLKLIRNNKSFGFEHTFILDLEGEGRLELNIDKSGTRIYSKICGDCLSIEELKKMQDLLQLAIDYQEAI